MGLNKINEIKKKLGMTTEELSQKSGVPIGTLNKILSGQTEDPKFFTLKAIARALGCTLDDFDDTVLDNHISNTLVEHFEEEQYTKEEQNEILQFAEFVREKRKYSAIAAHAIPGATKEDKKHDNDIMNDENF